jgi:hypothetical protein
VTEEALFASARDALRDGRAAEAIAGFEALADQGSLDAAESYDRGLAYALRVRLGAEVSGDLGRAAHGFEEARVLSTDAALTGDAILALGVVRAEVARRRARAGEAIEMEPSPPLFRSLVELLPESAWCGLALTGSLLVGLGLFVRDGAKLRRLRVGASVVVLVALLVLLSASAMALGARDLRLHVEEGVVVVPAARPADERGLTLPHVSPLPEGARVERLESKPGWVRVRWGNVDAWLPSPSIRPLRPLRPLRGG